MRERKLLVVFLVLTPWLLGQDQDQVAKVLADKSVGKVVTLRGFYTQDTLNYDSTGEPKFNGKGGAWTLFGKLEVSRIKVKKDRLEVEAGRMWVEWVPDAAGTRQVQFLRTRDSVFIGADLASGAGQKEIERLLGRIFVTPGDKMSDLVPAHWQRFFSSGEAASPKVSDGPQASPGASPEQTGAQGDQPAQGSRVRVSQMVSAGSLVKKAVPAYPEPAKRARLQGTVVLQAVIDTDGKVIKLSVLKPLGLGTEEAAVEAVSRWVYKPYLLAGAPVQVETQITVNYQLN